MAASFQKKPEDILWQGWQNQAHSWVFEVKCRSAGWKRIMILFQTLLSAFCASHQEICRRATNHRRICWAATWVGKLRYSLSSLKEKRGLQLRHWNFSNIQNCSRYYHKRKAHLVRILQSFTQLQRSKGSRVVRFMAEIWLTTWGTKLL